MQQELLEMLEKVLNWYDYIGSDSYYAKDTGELVKEAEALIEKAKNNAPAQEVGLTDVRIQELYEDCPSDSGGRFSLAEFAHKVWDEAIAMRAKEGT